MLLSSSQPAWRSPAFSLLANGQPMVGVIEAEAFANNHFGADSFCVSLALDANDAAPETFWSSATDILVDLRFSLDGVSFSSLIQGRVDSVAFDPVARTVRLVGRDFTAALIESRTQEAFPNRTSSEIATILAQRHNLTPVVTATTTLVGRYYESEHDRITLDEFSHATTEWDLLVFLARQEGFDLFVQGTELHFQPPASDTAQPVPLNLTDLISLRLERSLTLARDIQVTVKSWNSRQNSAFTQTASALAQTTNSGTTSLPAQNFVYVRPNLTPDQALKFAQQRLTELTSHERVFEATMPGEFTLGPRSVIALIGTGTDFDQLYYVDTIERSLGFDGGFTQRIRAKNTSPRTEATTPADVVVSVTGP